MKNKTLKFENTSCKLKYKFVVVLTMNVTVSFYSYSIALFIKSHCSIAGTQNANGRNDIK